MYIARQADVCSIAEPEEDWRQNVQRQSVLREQRPVGSAYEVVLLNAQPDKQSGVMGISKAEASEGYLT